MKTYDLNGNWLMKRTEGEEWISAKVPGSVYSDLLTADKMQDPYYRDNEYTALKLSSYDFEYKKTFMVYNDLLRHQHIFLVCEGLDTICKVYLNSKLIITGSNMHRTFEADIKDCIIEGKNTIQITFNSPVKYVEEKHHKLPLNVSPDTLDGFTQIRKAHYMFGWDWGPKLPDMGIWRNIFIRAYDGGRLEDIYITQEHVASTVILDVRVQTTIWDQSNKTLVLRVTSPAGKVFEQQVSLQKGKLSHGSPLDKFVNTTKSTCCGQLIENHIKLQISNPELWWPNTFGKQPLYNIEVALVEGDNHLDAKAFRIGLRTLSIRQQKDQWGESFEFVVNGIPIFSMGGDYIPEDSILSRCNRERTEKLIQSCVQANFNSIRVWGGGIYPEDYFYDLCDEYGLIVWQDLMFACGVYDLNSEFKENITYEVADNIKRLRHHASLGLWCGNNEQETAWIHWGWSDKLPSKYKADYIKQFEVLLPGIAEELDPNTFYWRSSPSSTGSFEDPNGENCGDMHYWGVWHEKNPFTDYRKLYPRFMSEFGIQSFPELKTIESFTLPEDRNIFSYVMEAHQKNGTANEKILYYIAENYKYPNNFDSLIYASQLIQAEGLRYGVEHWRRNRGRCMGAIYWQLNDCWPVASWASIDYYGRWKALHYAAKRFFAPVLISACEEGTKVSLHLSNETLKQVDGIVRWRLMDNCSRVLLQGETAASMPALSTGEIQSLDLSETLDSTDKKRNSYLEYAFIEGDVQISEGTVLFVKAKHFSFINPKLEVCVEEKSDCFEIVVSSDAYARFVELKLIDAEVIFSDNFFDLSKGTKKVISINKANLQQNLTLKHVQCNLTARSLFDTFD